MDLILLNKLLFHQQIQMGSHGRHLQQGLIDLLTAVMQDPTAYSVEVVHLGIPAGIITWHYIKIGKYLGDHQIVKIHLYLLEQILFLAQEITIHGNRQKQQLKEDILIYS